MLITRKKNDGLVIHVGNQEVTVSIQDVNDDRVSLTVESPSALQDAPLNGDESPVPRDDDKAVAESVSHVEFEKPDFKHIVLTPETDEPDEAIDEPSAVKPSSLWAFLRGMGSVMEIWPPPERLTEWRVTRKPREGEWSRMVREFWDSARKDEDNPPPSLPNEDHRNGGAQA
jgi:hypothetical protein